MQIYSVHREEFARVLHEVDNLFGNSRDHNPTHIRGKIKSLAKLLEKSAELRGENGYSQRVQCAKDLREMAEFLKPHSCQDAYAGMDAYGEDFPFTPRQSNVNRGRWNSGRHFDNRGQFDRNPDFHASFGPARGAPFRHTNYETSWMPCMRHRTAHSDFTYVPYMHGQGYGYAMRGPLRNRVHW